MIKINDCLSDVYKSSSDDFDDDTTPLKDLINKHPKYVALAYCARISTFYTLNAFLVTFLITILTLTSFSIECKSPQYRLISTFVLFLTVVTFKWVLNRSLTNASKLTSLDKYSNVCLLFIGLLASWHAIVGTFWQKELACMLDKWLLLAFALLLILIHLGLIGWLNSVVKQRRELEAKESKYFKLNKDKEIYIVRI